MKSQVLLTALTLFGSMVAAQNQIGCYKSTNGLKFEEKWDWQSVGRCSGTCSAYAAYGMIDKMCYCGNKIPADADKVADSQCNFDCPGFPANNCGGSNNRIMVYSIDKSNSNIPKADAATSSTSSTTSTEKPSSTASAKPTIITTEASGATVTVSAPAQTTSSSSEKSSSKPNTAGIAAGVVVGVLAILAAAGGAFLFLRRRKRRAIEEEHRRNATINSFVGKPPMSAGSSSFNDTRLDPVMAQRRMSDGSIADNQDYSRRILKVTNA